MKQLSNKEICEKAIELYHKNNDTPIKFEELAKYLKIDRHRLNFLFSTQDCSRVFPDVSKVLLRKIHLFDELTPLSCYWLGYIMADGCVAKSPRSENKYRLVLECQSKDRVLLENFCQICGLRLDRITYGHKGASVRLSLGETCFSTFVSKYGIVEKKSKKDNHIYKDILNDNELFLSYLKGYFDGDGNVNTSHGSPSISVVGGKSLLYEMYNTLSKLLPYPKSLWLFGIKPRAENSFPLYQLTVGVGTNKRLNSRYLYEKWYSSKCPVFLPRKKDKFLCII